MDDYDFLDQHDDMIEQQHHQWEKSQNHWNKGFGSSLTPPDPLDAVENSLTNPSPSLSHPPLTNSWDPGSPVPSPYRPPSPRWEPGMRTPDPLIDMRNEHHRYWREPPIPRLNPGLPKPFKPSFKEVPKINSKPSGTICPKDDKVVIHKECKDCDQFDEHDDVHDNCKFKAKEADRLAGKGD